LKIIIKRKFIAIDAYRFIKEYLKSVIEGFYLKLEKRRTEASRR
jgi:hypothetical protein